MSGASVPFSLPNPTTASRLVAQAGQTQIPGDASGTKLPSISGVGGWELDETTGAASARFRLWDGTGSGGTNIQIADVEVGQGATSVQTGAWIEIQNGAVYLEVVSGSVAGDVYVIT